MKEKVKCLNCGKEFEKYLSSSKKFCCKKCHAEFVKKQTQYVELTCKQCGKKFTRPAREVRAAEKRHSPIQFCSRKCHSDYWGRNRVWVTCPVCGKKFLQKKSIAHEHHCCSPECSAKNPANRRLMGDMVTLVCKQCGKPFELRESYVRKQNKRGQEVQFCSKECAGEWKSKLKKQERICQWCGKKFISRVPHKFCSGECRHSWITQGTKMLICKQCGKEFKATAYQIEHGRKFCSLKCFNEYRGIERDTYAKLQHYLRSSQAYEKWHKAVMQRASYKCEECGGTEQLNVHHAHITLYQIAKKYDFDEEKIINSKEFSDIDNGQCLCIDCHIKKHPYHKKLRNKKGQFCRRKFKAVRRLATKRTELSGKTVEKPQSEPKAPGNELDS